MASPLSPFPLILLRGSLLKTHAALGYSIIFQSEVMDVLNECKGWQFITTIRI